MQSPNRNQIHRALMLQKDPEIGSHKNLNRETSQMLETLSKRLSDTPRSVHVNFVTGLGLSDIGMPCRLNAIIIPTLRVMRRLRELGLEHISYRVYQATDFIIAENHLDREKALKVAQLMYTNMRCDIQECYPDLAPYVDLQFGIPVGQDTLDTVVDQLRDSDSPSLSDITQYANGKSQPILSAYRYAAANIICNGHMTPHIPDRYNVLMWWAKEKPFFQLGKDYERIQWYETGIIPLIQSTWAIPPYYPQIWKESYLTPDNRMVFQTEATPLVLQWDMNLTSIHIFS